MLLECRESLADPQCGGSVATVTGRHRPGDRRTEASSSQGSSPPRGLSSPPKRSTPPHPFASVRSEVADKFVRSNGLLQRIRHICEQTRTDAGPVVDCHPWWPGWSMGSTPTRDPKPVGYSTATVFKSSSTVTLTVSPSNGTVTRIRSGSSATTSWVMPPRHSGVSQSNRRRSRRLSNGRRS